MEKNSPGIFERRLYTVRNSKEIHPTKIYARKLPLVRNLPDLIDLQFHSQFN